MILLTMLLIPTFVAFMFFILSGKKITIGEFLAQNAIQVGVMSIFLFAHGCMSTSDTEVWNGKVALKNHHHVSCEHSYPCNPHSCMCDSKGNCSTCWDTCYSHSYDISWYLDTTNQERINIHRIDSQGLQEPPRWTAIKVGEPTTVAHSYVNYIKAAPDSLFRQQGLVEKYANKLSEYPQNIYDYYKLDRLVLANGAAVSNPKEWNARLSEINGELGARKQVNMAVVITKNQPDDYFYALQQSWMGGKKNDVVLVMSVDDAGKVQWAEVMAWTTDKLAEVVIKDSVLKIGTVADAKPILDALSAGVEGSYHRKSMKDFEYLSKSVTPTFWTWIASMIIGLIVSVGLGMLFLKNDYDQDDENDSIHGRSRFNRRYY